MSTITCKLFGVPQILKDGQPVFLPYSKINALLYYILVSKVVSREELAGLLWPDETDETARRNLRNAIYQAKKALGTNIILSPKKSLLMLNENLDLTLDIDQFLLQFLCFQRLLGLRLGISGRNLHKKVIGLPRIHQQDRKSVV